MAANSGNLNTNSEPLPRKCHTDFHFVLQNREYAKSFPIFRCSINTSKESMAFVLGPGSLNWDRTLKIGKPNIAT